MAFGAFELSCRNGVQELRLQRGSPDLLLPVAACFTRLVTLNVDYIPQAGVQALGSLSGHPTLRDLFIRGGHHDIKINLMTCLAAFRNIRNLVCFCDVKPYRYNERSFHAFRSMVHGMENLTSFRTLYIPSIQSWQNLTEWNVTSNSLIELKIVTLVITVENFEAMIQVLPKFAPKLTTLHLGRFPSVPDERIFRTLSGLQQHPSLNKLELVTYVRLDGLDAFFALQQEMVNRITVVAVKLSRD